MALPKKPQGGQSPSIDDVIAAQEKIRQEATGTPVPVKKASVKAPVASSVQSQAVTAVAPSTVPSASNLVAQGETLKQTQFNLPVSLNERIAKVAEAFHAGNRSHFVRAVLERAVAEYEERLNQK
jgi:hypothetical protein